MAEQIEDDIPEPTRNPTVWSENHGNLLLMVMVGVFLVGSIILFYRQSRLRKPPFPDSSAIQQVSAESSEGSTDREISIVVIGAANADGMISVAIYDSVKTFNEPFNAFRKDSLSIVDGQATLRIPADQLPEKFAVAAFHDENGDGELNRNRIGIPSERYGFSQNARGLTGPPPFQQAVVDRSELERSLEISIR